MLTMHFFKEMNYLKLILDKSISGRCLLGKTLCSLSSLAKLNTLAVGISLALNLKYHTAASENELGKVS